MTAMSLTIAALKAWGIEFYEMGDGAVQFGYKGRPLKVTWESEPDPDNPPTLMTGEDDLARSVLNAALDAILAAEKEQAVAVPI